MDDLINAAYDRLYADLSVTTALGVVTGTDARIFYQYPDVAPDLSATKPAYLVLRWTSETPHEDSGISQCSGRGTGILGIDIISRDAGTLRSVHDRIDTIFQGTKLTGTTNLCLRVERGGFVDDFEETRETPRRVTSWELNWIVYNT